MKYLTIPESTGEVTFAQFVYQTVTSSTGTASVPLLRELDNLFRQLVEADVDHEIALTESCLAFISSAVKSAPYSVSGGLQVLPYIDTVLLGARDESREIVRPTY